MLYSVKLLLIFKSAFLFTYVVAKNEEYMGHKVYNIKFINQTQQDNFYKLKNDLIDFWTKPCFKYNTIGRAMVPPSEDDWFEEKLEEIGVDRDVHIENVYVYLNDKEQFSSRNSTNETTAFNFDTYHRYDVILNYLYTLENTYENTSITLKVIQYGVTAENRPLIYIKLSNGNDTNKPVVVIEAGTNPREWITVPSALNVVSKLLEDNQTYLNDFTWIVIPVLNPDGYEYTHTNLRLWTKSRSLNSYLGFICPGANLNRNFDIDWLISDSSSSPCSHLYAGVAPFSEIETRLIRDIIEEYKPQVYIALQNNGKFVTFPWMYEKAASGLFRRHYLRGLDIVRNLEGYKLDSGALAFGDRQSGTSADYARMERISYTYNIGVEGTGDAGVIVPEEDIQEIAENVWRAVIAAVSSEEIN